MSDMDDILEKLNQEAVESIITNTGGTAARDYIVTEISHPTDLLTCSPYWELSNLLVKLEILPWNVHLMTSKFWDEYNQENG